jgi:hypothetical protein
VSPKRASKGQDNGARPFPFMFCFGGYLIPNYCISSKSYKYTSLIWFFSFEKNVHDLPLNT